MLLPQPRHYGGWLVPLEHKILSLALTGRPLALVSAVEELAVEELHGYHREDDVEQDVDNKNVEHVLEGVDDTVKHSFQLGHAFDGLQWPQDSEDTQRFDGAEILSSGASPA